MGSIPFKTMENDVARERVTKSETFSAVQHVFPTILLQRGQATADAIRERLDIHPDGLPAIGRAIGDLSRQGVIEFVRFELSSRAMAHQRPLRVWRMANEKSQASGTKGN